MPRRWTDLSRVERVDLYTRASLHLSIWTLCGVLLLGAAGESMGSGQRAALLGGGLAVTSLASLTMHSVMTNWPASPPTPWTRIGVLLGASGAYFAAVGLPAEGGAVRGTVVMVVIVSLCASLGGRSGSTVTAALVVGSGLVGGLSGGDFLGVVAGLGMSLVVIFSVRVSLWLLRVVTEIDAARLVSGQLAVVEERLRFSRDVHDVLGRRLCTIAVQSELAATLAARGDDRAAARMLEVRGVAHEGLQEARELARGYRPVNLPHEVEGARSLLRSAGIDVEVELDVVPRDWHEAAGWVVRESVTNLLRHSDARQVHISYRGDELRIDNDGVGHDEEPRGVDPGGGMGLHGVRERLRPLGASLITCRDGERWSVVAHLPGTGPARVATIPRELAEDAVT